MRRTINRVLMPGLVAVWLAGAPEGAGSMQERQVSGGVVAGGLASAAVQAGGLIYVSGLVATGDDGRVVGVDVRTQTQRVLDRMKTVLEGAGSALSQTVAVNVFLRYASDFEAMNNAYREYFADQPPTRTTVVADPSDGALVAISAVALPLGASREVLHPAGWMKSPRPYSYIVRAGDLVFLSGLVSRRGTDDQFVGGWVRDQVKTILDNAGTLLKTAGLGYENVVSARVFLTSGSFFEEMNDEYRKYFPTAPPARATVVTGLMGPEAFAEITIVASSAPKQIVGPDITSSLPLSTAVRVGRRLFLSGVLGNTDQNMGDLAGQTRETFARIRKTLEMAGVTPADIVDATVYLAEPWQRHLVDPTYKAFFPANPPARTLVGAGLVQRPALIEILMTAFK
jgi:enamine deaminase RidA (YjgF/YER057c/UK114 family)